MSDNNHTDMVTSLHLVNNGGIGSKMVQIEADHKMAKALQESEKEGNTTHNNNTINNSNNNTNSNKPIMRCYKQSK